VDIAISGELQHREQEALELRNPHRSPHPVENSIT
jgi:hypothetical protein